MNADSESTSCTTSSFASSTDYSTTVVRAVPAIRSSILTVRQPFLENDSDGTMESINTIRADTKPSITDSMLSIESFHTAPGSMLSVAGATEGGSTLRGPLDIEDGIRGSDLRAAVNGDNAAAAYEPSERPSHLDDKRLPSPSPQPALLHRFTLIKPGAKRAAPGIGAAVSSSSSEAAASTGSPLTANSGPSKSSPNGVMAPIPTAMWSPFDFFFSTGLLVARCDLCSKRLGWKPVLECDDCGLR